MHIPVLQKKTVLTKRYLLTLKALWKADRSTATSRGERHYSIVDGNEKISLSCAMPIIAEGDVIGAVATILMEDQDQAPSDVEIKLIQTAAVFLGKQLEE